MLRSKMRSKLAAVLAVALAVLASAPVMADDLSKKVEIQFYMLGDPPKDLPVVQAEVNKLAEKELNATVKFNYVPWTGWDQKYSLLLTSGQPIDLIFTAEWTGYNDYAKRGAFQDIGDLVKKSTPDLYQFVPKDYWDAVKVGGKVYTVPATWKEYVNNGIVYREDLRKKYNLPKPDSLANLETYLEGIKKNVPGVQPVFQQREFALMDYPLMGFKYPLVEAPTNGSFGLRYNYAKAGVLFDYFGSSDFVEDAKLIKRWADKGFWPKDSLSVNTPEDALLNGKVAATFSGQNAVKYAAIISQTKNSHPDWEFGYIPFVYTDKLVHPVHPTHNGFAVPRAAKNPERALMLYAKMVLDKRYNWLTQYGIEGKNFTVSDDGHYQMIGDNNTNGFPREAMNGWAWRNPQFQLFDNAMDVPLKLFKEYDSLATPNIKDGFALDLKPIQAEVAAYNQVYVQYGLPIYMGLAGEPTAAVKKFLEKGKAAGLEKIQAEVKKQWEAYYAELVANAK